MVEIRQLTAEETVSVLTALGEILIDCVEGGASVHFMPPLWAAMAEGFFKKIVTDMEKGDRVLLAAFDGSKLVNTVQVQLGMPPNQPHRAEIAKLLVHRNARHKGLAVS